MRLKTALALRALDAIQAIPPTLTRPLAWPLALVLFLAVERRVTLDNMKRVYPQWPRWRRGRLALHAYLQAARSLVAFLQSERYSDDEIIGRVMVDERDEERLVRALAGGRGALILTGHYGNWGWLAPRARAGGYPLAVLSKRPKDPDLDARLRRLEVFTPIDPGDTRALLRWLRAGKVLALLMDQEPPRRKDGVVVPLLGQPTLTYTGPFRLARMAGAPMFTAFVRRTGPRRHRVRLEPFEPSADPDLERALAADAAAFNARLEAFIREAPDEWLWMYGRWRRLDRILAREAGAGATPGAEQDPGA